MTQRKGKKELQREQTHQALIETAEALFAEQGIADVSLRQISEHAGSLNTSVVGYYFGSKEALIDAIYRHRLPQIEQWRAAFLQDCDQRGCGMDIAQLLTVIWMPWFEHVDRNGVHSYARFLMRINREGLSWTRTLLDPEYPASMEAYRRLILAFRAQQVPNWEFRFAVQTQMILETLQYIDAGKIPAEQSRMLFADALTMAQVAIIIGTSPRSTGKRRAPRPAAQKP